MIYKPSYLGALTHSTLLCICQRNQKKRLLCKVKEMRMDVSGLKILSSIKWLKYDKKITNTFNYYLKNIFRIIWPMFTFICNKRLLCKVKEMRMDVSGLQLSIPT
jgi:hypothetical protein